MRIDRRQFTLAAAAAFTIRSPVHAAEEKPQRNELCAFIKHLDALKYDELAEQIADAGFDGVEVPCRKGETYIRPERAADELPRFQEALKKRGLKITILTTDILRPDEPHAEDVLRAAAKLGVKRYRLGFAKYDLKKPIIPQLDALRPAFRDLAAMNRSIGIAGVYQNHSGAEMMGATVWDLHNLIKDISVGEIGCVFDIRHAATEAGEAWPVYFNLMKPHLGAVSVKDFRWKGRKSEHVPLGEGQVDPVFFQMLRLAKYAGPISVHVEYLPKGDSAKLVAALKRDLAMLRNWLDA